MRALAALTVASTFALAGLARAQDAGAVDAGAVDAGAADGGAPSDGGALDDGGALSDGGAPCAGLAPACDGDVLRFCDEVTGEVRALDCAAELGGRCGLLSDEWGADCLLPEGAPCDPGYADGLSRCEGSAEATRCCVDGACASPPASTESCLELVPGAPDVGPDTAPAPGDGATTTTTPSASCPTGSCAGPEPTPFAALALGLFMVGRFTRRAKKR